MGKIAFSIGPVVVHSYGIIVAFAALTGFLVGLWQARIQGQRLRPVLDLVLYGVPVGIVSARLYYVAANWDIYRVNLAEIFRIWHGGLAIHGALLGVVLVLFIYTRMHGLRFWSWADIIAPGLAAGAAVGQWANFVNQEAFGYPTDSPWGIYIDFANRPAGFEQYDFFQPVFLYESGWYMAVFILLCINSYLNRRYGYMKPGSGFLILVLIASIGKILTDGLRLDGEMVGGMRLAQLVGGASIFIAVWLLSRLNMVKQGNVMK